MNKKLVASEIFDKPSNVSIVSQDLLSGEATLVMLALLEGLADNVLSGDAWAQSIQHAFAIACDEYHVKPEVFQLVINRVMEFKDKRGARK